MTWDKYYTQQKLSHGVSSCDIGLTYARTWNPISNLIVGGIRKVSNGLFNHAILIGKDGDIIEANPTGIEVTKLSKYVSTDDGVIFIRNITLTDTQKKIILAYAYGCVGGDYSFGDLWNFIFRTGADTKHRFCSELVAESFNTADLKISHKPLSDTAPHDIFDYQYTAPEGYFNSDSTWILSDVKDMNMEAVKEFQKNKWGR